MTAMYFSQQKKPSQHENFSLARLIFIAALLVVATTLHGCGPEACPNDGRPIENGMVFFKCKGDECIVDNIKCNPGFGYGVESPEDLQMDYHMNTEDQCVIRLVTADKRKCHKCNEGSATATDTKCAQKGGHLLVTEFANGKLPVSVVEDKDFEKFPDEAKFLVGEAPGGEKFGKAMAHPTDPTKPGPKANETPKETPNGPEANEETPKVPAEGDANKQSAESKEPEAKGAAASSLVDIRVHNQGSNSPQIASADIDAKQTVSVSLVDVDVHHDGSLSVPEATTFPRQADAASTRENGLDHTIKDTRAAAQEPQLKTRWHKSRISWDH